MTDNKMSKHKAAAEIIDTHRSIWCADGEGLVCLCDDWGVEVHDDPRASLISRRTSLSARRRRRSSSSRRLSTVEAAALARTLATCASSAF